MHHHASDAKNQEWDKVAIAAGQPEKCGPDVWQGMLLISSE